MRRLSSVLAALGALVVLLAGCGPTALPARGAAAAPAAARPETAAAQLGAPGDQVGGRLLFVKDGNLWVWERGNAHLLAEGGTFRQPAWSPDGTQIAFVLRSNNFSDIFLTDPRGADQVRLTESQSRILEENDWNFRPTWSPDGSRIAFVSDAGSNNPTLWIMRPDGSGQRQVITPGSYQDAVDGMAWSPDGSRLALTHFSGPGPSQIALVTVPDTGRALAPTAVTGQADGAMDPAFSPDGAWLAYAGRDGKDVDIYVIRPDGSGQQRLTHSGLARSPVFSPDGQHIAYLSAQSGSFEVWLLDVQPAADGGLQATNERQLTKDLGLDAASGISWTR